MPSRQRWLLMTLAVVVGVSLWLRITAVDHDEIRRQAESIAAESAARLADRSDDVSVTVGWRDQAAADGLGRDRSHENGVGSDSDSHPHPDTDAATADNGELAAGADTDADTDADTTADTNTDADAGEQPVLRAEVYDVINEVQERFMAQQWEEGLEELNALYEDFDQLNAFEQATVLNFYTNALLNFGMYDEAIVAFEDVLGLPDLQNDVESRATLALGQLHANQENYEASAAYLSDWLALERNSSADAPGADAVLLLLANAHFHMENYGSAIAFLEDYIGVRMHMGQPVPRQQYELLSQLHTQTGNQEDAEAVQRILQDLED